MVSSEMVQWYICYCLHYCSSPRIPPPRALSRRVLSRVGGPGLPQRLFTRLAVANGDDIGVAGDSFFLERVLLALVNVALVGFEKREEYVYYGVQLNMIEITLDQEKYITDVPEIKLNNDSEQTRAPDTREKKAFHGLIRALSWCAG